MAFPTPADRSLAQWLVELPGTDPKTLDGSIVVMLACDHGWQVDPAALDVVRQAAAPLGRPIPPLLPPQGSPPPHDAAADQPANDD